MKKIIVAMTGASGTMLGVRLLKALHETGEVETHLVISRGALAVLEDEDAADDGEKALRQVEALADFVYAEDNLAASISSGSFRTEGMIILPCSMKTLSGIANAYDENLIIRAADVCLKEGRRLVVCPRETPLSAAHLRNMLTLKQDGAIIMPPVFTYYSHPKTLEEMENHFIGKVMQQFDLSYPAFHPWEGKE